MTSITGRSEECVRRGSGLLAVLGTIITAFGINLKRVSSGADLSDGVQLSFLSSVSKTQLTSPHSIQFIHYTINSSSHSPCTPRNRTRYLFKPWSIPYTSKLPSHNIQYTLHKIASRVSEKGSAVNTKQPESHHPSINDNDS